MTVMVMCSSDDEFGWLIILTTWSSFFRF